ncbi:MAG: hypothetical protein HY901_23565 [Deltaproteobacteria bacterium]|nr:hypothetical protein [Deltaproteobacteria bacterium]
MVPTRSIFIASVLALFAGCSSESPSTGPGADAGVESEVGQLGGACFPNQSCFGSLLCQSSVCVEASDAGEDAPVCTECDAGSSECIDGQVRFCFVDDKGCTSWTSPQDCPDDKPYCSQDACRIACSDDCTTLGERRCSGTGYQGCEESPASSCLVWGQVISCGPSELCHGGECLPNCSGAPCACQLGDTAACADIGVCTGGVRACRDDGTFGPCLWTSGPTIEECDGRDNDCNGHADDNLVAPACSKQKGVCAGAVKTCTAAGGWRDCDALAYQTYAQQKSLTYQSAETLCDGQDNDCSGSADELASCCQPSCTGKGCGADDGCGNPCQAGTCLSAQEVCVQGGCVCQPSCSGKVCGGPDGCGGTCKVGSCAAPNSVCNAGTCACAHASCGSTCCAAGEYCQGGACTPGVTPGWKTQASNTQRDLNGVWGSAANDVWAVGAGGTVLHYSGNSWSPGTSNTTSDLSGVSGSASDNVWAIGWRQILRYDGTMWSPVSYLNTSDTFDDVFVTGEHVFLAGNNGASSNRHPVVAHYDGSSWQRWEQVGSNGYLTAIGGSSPTDVWAHGWMSVLHFDGTWREFGYSNTNDLYGIVGFATDDFWGVGEAIQRYDGSSWTEVTSPSSSRFFYGINGRSPDDIWAVGGFGAVIHYDGQGWSVSGVGTTGEHLRGVWAASSGEAWAVGTTGTILHYAP